MNAFRLAFQRLNGDYASSRYAYVSPEAAVRAAPTLNSVRQARSQIPYSALAQYDDAQFVRLIDLPRAA